MRFTVEFAGGAWAFWATGALAAATVWHARRSPAGKALLAVRAVAALCLALAALKPSIASQRPSLVKPKLAIIIDEGHSMEGERLRAVLDWLKKNRAEIEERAEPAVFAASNRARPVAGLRSLDEIKGHNAGFHPADAFRDVIEETGNSASRAWLFSDGNVEPAEDWERVLGRLNTPLDVVGVGPARRGRGVSFLDIKTPDFVFLHGRFEVQVSLEATELAAEELTVRLSKESVQGEKKEWVLSEEKRVRARSDYDVVTASFSAAAQSLGLERYRLEVGRRGEPAAAREFRVEVIRQKYRIMYLSGRPSSEYANLREFLKSDPNHELVSFVILRNPDNAPFVADTELSLIPFPAEEIFVQSLSQFDLFILENFSYRRFNLPASYLSALKGFVSSGGALLVIGGENAFGLGGYRGTPVEEILPVTLSQSAPDFLPGLFRAKPAALDHPLARLYDTADASRSAWDALPPMDGFARFGSVRPGATVLAVHPYEKTADGKPLPVFAIRDYGRGKVMLVSSDSTWRWRLGAAQDWRTASFYGRFWSRAVQYLTGSLDLSKVKFAPLPDHLPRREPATLSLRVFDENFHPAPGMLTEISVVWTSPGGGSRAVVAQEKEPGVYVVELTGLFPGAHRVKASARLRGKPWGEDQVRFLWESGEAEAPMDRKWLEKTATSAGGGLAMLKSASAAELLDKLPPVRRESRVRARYHPWASSFWLWMTAVLLLAEWALRRWRGHA